MITKKHIVAIRFSAMGDVAMCVPVIRLLLQQHPELSISFVSDKKLSPLFSGIDRCKFIAADLKGKHRGLRGMFRLFNEIRSKGKADGIADLHHVIRTRLLKLFFSFTGLKTYSINKGRKEKKQLVSWNSKVMKPLKSGFKRYADVFEQMGFPVILDHDALIVAKPHLPDSAKKLFGIKIGIGIAPFAKHQEKMYDPNKMKMVVTELAKSDVNILLFGGGDTEKKILDGWIEEGNNNIFNITGKFTLEEELAIIIHLKLMCSMDSANMHLASLYNVPVVSIWGATHPFAGFLGWGQKTADVIDTDMPCRPCSIYGNKACRRGDHACMEQIHPETIISRIQYKISK